MRSLEASLTKKKLSKLLNKEKKSALSQVNIQNVLLFTFADSLAPNAHGAEEVFTQMTGLDAREAVFTILRVSRAMRASVSCPREKSLR